MIIGISGKIGAGKTELARILYTHFGYEPKIFAGKLKTIAAILTGTTESEQYNRRGKDRYLEDWDMTIGEFQQRLGTDAVRNGLHQDAWVLALFADYKGTEDWSISDVRFRNEAGMITDMGGIMVRIDGSRTGPGNRDPNHSSETELDNYEFHYRFTNDGTREKLVEHAHRIHRLARCDNMDEWRELVGKYGSPTML